jgi:hypothetical protein
MRAKRTAKLHTPLLRRTHVKKRFVCFCLASAFSWTAATSLGAPAAASAQIPLTADNWQTHGNATFIAREAFPNGILQVTSESEQGFVALKNQQFDNGTIEFDIKPVGEEMPGIRFRQTDGDTADMLYIRVNPDCPAGEDCLQYVPIIKGRVLWDVYPQYQASAPFRENEWNHIRLVISGKRMNVYVNRQSEPSLRVTHLEGESKTGTIAFEGTAYYANLAIVPGLTDGLDPNAPTDPVVSDHRYIVRWQATKPVSTNTMDHLDISSMPSSGSVWSPIGADYGGLINLSRYYAPTPKQAPAQVIWLRSTVMSDRDQIRHVAVGWLREISVFANGKALFSGKNLYNVKGARKAPDGRLSLENGSFDLPLHKGANEIVVAIDANTPDMRGRYGWGFIMRMDKAEGIATPSQPARKKLNEMALSH